MGKNLALSHGINSEQQVIANHESLVELNPSKRKCFQHGMQRRSNYESVQQSANELKSYGELKIECVISLFHFR